MTIVALKYAAYDYGQEPSEANRETLAAAATSYYRAFESYKGEREV